MMRTAEEIQAELRSIVGRLGEFMKIPTLAPASTIRVRIAAIVLGAHLTVRPLSGVAEALALAIESEMDRVPDQFRSQFDEAVQTLHAIYASARRA